MKHCIERLRALGLGGLLAATLGLGACDPQAIGELEEGVATEADVVQRFGQPERVWPEDGGAKTYEYNRQPSGLRNYMITIGPDGKMSALRQVLTPENFARIQAGMGMDEVRRRLGKPAKVTPYALSGETHYDWRFLEPPNTAMLFTVVTDRSLRVLRTQTTPDMASPDHNGPR